MKTKILISIALSLFIFSSCTTKIKEDNKIKYVFYFIGDGMGAAQAHLAELYYASLDSVPQFPYLNMNKLQHHTYFTTHAENRLITGSAASGTALASGNKTCISVIGQDCTHEIDFSSVAKKAMEKSMKVGIITTVSIDHATPACFYAHQLSRSMYYEIGSDLIYSDFDLFAGGGFKKPDNANQNAEKNLISLAKQNGYRYINSKDTFLNYKPNNERIIAVNPVLVGAAAMPYAIDKTDKGLSLKQITKKAIEILDNANGFFMMIEGGKIDWACHLNDGVTAMHEVIDMDEAIGAAMEFYNKHPNQTLIIVCADHETGGLSLGVAQNQYELYLNLLQYQKVSQEAFEAILNEKYFKKGISLSFADYLKIINQYFGLGDEDKGLSLDAYEMDLLKTAYKDYVENKKIDKGLFIKYGGYLPLSVAPVRILNAKAGLGWTSWAHTGIQVPLRYQCGNRDVFNGFLDNTDIPIIIEKLISE